MTVTSIATAGQGTRTTFRPATFGDVLRSEWTKLRSVRSTFWALTLAVVLGIGLGAAISAAAAHSYAKESIADKLTWDPTGQHLRAGHRPARHRRARRALHELGVFDRDDPHQLDRRPQARPGAGGQVVGLRLGHLHRR